MSRLDKIEAVKDFLKKGPPGGYVQATNSEGKKIVTNSPKATGVVKNFSMGKTRSGKVINSFPDHQDHHNFSDRDHMDAYKAHIKHVSELDEDTHPSLIAHHKAAIQFHYKKAFAHQVQKAVAHKAAHRHRVGKTRSGKIIHRDHHANHPYYSDFTSKDHADASHAHNRRVERLIDAMMHFHGKSPKLVKHFQKLIKKHGSHAHLHHSKSLEGLEVSK
ncbi:MAG: hypothetical protein ACXVCY_04190 [Pseudobdellovibrionaceae bacterium]